MQPPVIVMMMPPNQLQNQLQAFGGAMINPMQGNFQPMASYFNAFNNSQPQHQPSSVPRNHQGGKMEVKNLYIQNFKQFFNLFLFIITSIVSFDNLI